MVTPLLGWGGGAQGDLITDWGGTVTPIVDWGGGGRRAPIEGWGGHNDRYCRLGGHRVTPSRVGGGTVTPVEGWGGV